MNAFSLEEEQSDSNYSRKLNLSFTDAAIDKVASVLGGYVPLTPSMAAKHGFTREQNSTLPSFQQLEGSSENKLGILPEEAVEATVQVQSLSEGNNPSSHFEKDGQGFLISATPDYKGKNKKIQQQRFNLLYVWAYNLLHGEPVPNKEHLNQAAKVNGVYDGNYAKHLNDVASRFFIKSDGTFKLNPGGRSEVNKILAEMQDLDSHGFEYWSSTRKNISRGTRITKDDAQKIDQWIQIQSKFDSFDVRTLDTVVKYAILALYDITKELKVQDAVKTGLAYEYLVKRYKTISVSKESFGKALTNNRDYGKYFGRTSEGLYYLTPDAESVAEGWLSECSIQLAQEL